MASQPDDRYEHPYPAPDLAARHPFVVLEPHRYPVGEMRARALSLIHI